MDVLFQPITLTFEHRVYFTRDAFALQNAILETVLAGRVLVFLDGGVAAARPELAGLVEAWMASRGPALRLVAGGVVVVPGGEAGKNDWTLVERMWGVINDHGVDRHSCVLVIGGGAFLDMAGFAVATAHRGIRLVRMPTTTLSQGDGGVGVKNGVGAFAVPWAVVNDFSFLHGLPAREVRAGLIEGVKVALLRDAVFFRSMEEQAEALARLESDAVERVVRRGAELHFEHITTGGDPFELGSARPLDFGHWVAHKLEPLSEYRLNHGEAVAIGMAVDLIYARRLGILAADDCGRILALLEKMGFVLYDPHLEDVDSEGQRLVLRGLEEFREHLGGRLTITLVTQPGCRIEVHEMKMEVVCEAIEELRDRSAAG